MNRKDHDPPTATMTGFGSAPNVTNDTTAVATMRQLPVGYPYTLSVAAPEVEAGIRAVCAELTEILVAKNRAYGNSALNPIRCFSRADPIEQLRVRLDDKLSRVMRGVDQGDSEDVILDLLGYLVLLRVAKRGAR